MGANSGQTNTSVTEAKAVKDMAILPNLAVCWLGNPLNPRPGHVDWMVAQFTGAIGWLNHADDFDFNFMLFPKDDAGVAPRNGIAHGVS